MISRIDPVIWEKKEQLNVIIKDENLKPAETDAFMQRAFADGFVTETGTGIAKILPPSNPFLPESDEKKQTKYTAESLLCTCCVCAPKLKKMYKGWLGCRDGIGESLEKDFNKGRQYTS